MNAKATSVEDSFWVERGFVVRVHNGVNYSEYAFNEISLDRIDPILSQIDKLVDFVSFMSTKEIEANPYDLFEEAVIDNHFADHIDTLPDQVSAKEKIRKLKDVLDKTMAIDKRLVDTRVSYEEVHISKVFISQSKNLSQSYVWANGALIPIAYSEGQYKYSIGMISGLSGPELLSEFDGIIKKTSRDVLDMIGTTPVRPGEYDIILDPDITGLLAHEAFGHGVEMDMFVKHRAKAADYMNQRVASDLVHMRDGSTSAREVSSYLFDDEGVLGMDTSIIKQGILKSGIADLLSATKLGGVKATGNGKRESFEHKAYTRMTNTFIEGGNHKLEAMIKSISHGYLIEGFFSGMEDPKNWGGIQCVAARAREIIDGKLTGKVHSPVFLTGYVPDLLQSITMVSEDVELVGNGTCSKGVKERVKTSTGGPYIRAKGRLS